MKDYLIYPFWDSGRKGIWQKGKKWLKSPAILYPFPFFNYFHYFGFFFEFQNHPHRLFPPESPDIKTPNMQTLFLNKGQHIHHQDQLPVQISRGPPDQHCFSWPALAESLTCPQGALLSSRHPASRVEPEDLQWKAVRKVRTTSDELMVWVFVEASWHYWV